MKKRHIGVIINSEIRFNKFHVVVHDKEGYDDLIIGIFVGVLELVNSDITDEEILEDLPDRNPKWWCKVEDGYIKNLNGEKKNKIPYDYNS